MPRSRSGSSGTSKTKARPDPRDTLKSTVAKASKLNLPSERIRAINRVATGNKSPSIIERVLFPLQVIQKNLISDPLDKFTKGDILGGIFELAKANPVTGAFTEYAPDTYKAFLGNDENALNIARKTPSTVLEKNLDVELPFLAELGIDIAADPLTYVSFGSGAVAKGAARGAARSVAAQAALKSGEGLGKHGVKFASKLAKKSPAKVRKAANAYSDDILRRLHQGGAQALDPEEIAIMTAGAARGESKKVFKEITAAAREDLGKLLKTGPETFTARGDVLHRAGIAGDLDNYIRPQDLTKIGSSMSFRLQIPFGDAMTDAAIRTFGPGRTSLAALKQGGKNINRGLRLSTLSDDLSDGLIAFRRLAS